MEIIANDVQEVEQKANVLFTDTVIKGNKWISHRTGSGLITLKGLKGCDCGCQPKARYLVTFSGNVSAPTVPGVVQLSVAIAIDGEPIQATRMRVTIANAGDYYNVAASTYIDTPNGCCSKISVVNTSNQTINIQNANLTAVRVA